MSLSASEIALIAKILDRDLRSAAVREVLSPREQNRILLLCRGIGENHHLQFCLDSAHCRLGRVKEKPPRAEMPHPFVMLLRKTLVGKRIESVAAVGGDRVVRIAMVSLQETCFLAAELTARHANLFLLGQDNRIVGSFFPNRSSLRNLTPGEIYVPPFHHPTQESANRFEQEVDPEAAVERFYSQKEADAELKALRNRLLRDTVQARKKAEKLLSALRKDLEHAADAPNLAMQAEVLKANLGNIPRGCKAFSTVDFEGRPVVILLDPKKGPKENMSGMFDKAGRLKRALVPITARMEAVVEQTQKLERRESELQTADETQLRRLADTSGRHPSKKAARIESRATNATIRLPYREFSIGSGRPARVGRGAKDNDELTLKYAKPDDLWLHIRNAAGSHVVVPMGRKENPHPDLLIDAAHLAAHFSSLKGQSDVEVLYTRRRYVQKQKGAAPGSVRLLQEKCIQLRVDEERLKKILHGDPVYQSTQQ